MTLKILFENFLIKYSPGGAVLPHTLGNITSKALAHVPSVDGEKEVIFKHRTIIVIIIITP